MIKNFKEWLNEGAQQTYDYGCSMLYFEFPEMEKIHAMIDPEHVYVNDDDSTFGLEKEPHVTLLYGLHSDEISDDDVIAHSKDDHENVTLHNPSLFENEKYDVLKFDAKGESLHAANKRLVKFPHTTNFPDYHPHCTIAYLKSGKGKEVLKVLKEKLDPEYGVECKEIVYSKPDGTKVKHSLK